MLETQALCISGPYRWFSSLPLVSNRPMMNVHIFLATARKCFIDLNH